MLIPEVEPEHWWTWPLHNQRGALISRAVRRGSDATVCRLRLRLGTADFGFFGEILPRRVLGPRAPLVLSHLDRSSALQGWTGGGAGTGPALPHRALPQNRSRCRNYPAGSPLAAVLTPPWRSRPKL
ncbi:hypothetical protein [Streptacidiphilus rugosus]|uniref:hypothetical protein n=1 Tax=Streptacidiphilus rugosus TaxID=405783 RepID=UPI00056D999A|nr:hypothetical protein [Streptacidiphilus rugosus]